jgi:NADPH:quinone reductase-like Zn-dependent oxidoreductase
MTSMQSKAVVFRGDGVTCRVENVRVDPPGANEVMIKVAACGVCHSDLSATNGTMPVPPPVILGHEVAGVVERVGPGVSGFAVGDRVISSFDRLWRHDLTMRRQGDCRSLRRSAVATPGIARLAVSGRATAGIPAMLAAMPRQQVSH